MGSQARERLVVLRRLGSAAHLSAEIAVRSCGLNLAGSCWVTVGNSWSKVWLAAKRVGLVKRPFYFAPYLHFPFEALKGGHSILVKDRKVYVVFVLMDFL